jgi:uncharacterized protein YjbI with pentapeptide repeats
MKVIKTREELLNLLDSNKDLIIDDDVTIEFSTSREDVRNVRCKNLFMAKGNNRFDLSICGNFNGWNFTGVNFTGWNFNGRNFTGWNFNGRDFTGGNFTGGDFNGRDFTGGDFTGGNFTGGNFNGRNFTGWNFNGGDIAYYAFFCCYGKIIKSGKITAQYSRAHKPIELGKD